MQEALWTVDVSRANDIDHFKKPEDVYHISVSNERIKKGDCRVFLPFRYTRVRIQTPSTQMMLAILTSLVRNENIKSISLEDDDARPPLHTPSNFPPKSSHFRTFRPRLMLARSYIPKKIVIQKISLNPLTMSSSAH